MNKVMKKSVVLGAGIILIALIYSSQIIALAESSSNESASIEESTSNTVEKSDSNKDSVDEGEVVTEETNKALGSQITAYYSDENTQRLSRSAIDVVYAGEINRPSSDFIDVSSWNGTITVAQYQLMKSYGITGVVVKATEGTSYSNPYAASQINNAISAGLKVSVYHYAHYTTDTEAQNEAAYFSTVVSNLGLSKSVNMVIDIEEGAMNNSKINTTTKTFKSTLVSKGYSNIYYYMSKSWLDNSNGPFSITTFGEKNIWVAQYPYSPTASMNWNSSNASWQWSSAFYINSISGAFDISSDYTGTFTNASEQITGMNNLYYFKNTISSGDADFSYNYGESTDEILIGDWDGDGIDTLAIRRGNVYYIKNSLTSGSPDKVITYGKTTDEVLVGDWNGDGKDTLAVRRGMTYYIKNSIAGGDADKVISYGKATDKVLVGDWDGDGKDTLAVRRGSTYYIKNTIAGGVADKTISYGKPTDEVLVGDWNGDGKDTLTVRRGNTYYIKNIIGSGLADRTVSYGRGTDIAYAGDWNGDKTDTLVLRR